MSGAFPGFRRRMIINIFDLVNYLRSGTHLPGRRPQLHQIEAISPQAGCFRSIPRQTLCWERVMTNQQRAVRARIHGKVQGVSYRVWTRSEAMRLGLAGWVRNESDGTVTA